jgi:hypothetical protein
LAAAQSSVKKALQGVKDRSAMRRKKKNAGRPQLSNMRCWKINDETHFTDPYEPDFHVGHTKMSMF